MGDLFAPFGPWLARWALTPDGAPFATGYSRSLLLPVRRDGVAAMLKLATEPEERRGAGLMAWWAGDGAADVLEHMDEALLLERLDGPRSLAALAHAGRDDEASGILCAVAARLHAPRGRPPPKMLVPLETWLRALAPAAAREGGVLQVSSREASALLADPRDPVVLHGDLHHANVLDGGERGWRAIDPKGLWGERAYEFATTLCNPDAETALAPGRLARQIGVIAAAAALEPRRLTRWLVAHAGVAAVWCVQDGHDPAAAFALAEAGAALL